MTDRTVIDTHILRQTGPGFHHHLLGTDTLGRDVLASLLDSARMSMLIDASLWALYFVLRALVGRVRGWGQAGMLAAVIVGLMTVNHLSTGYEASSVFILPLLGLAVAIAVIPQSDLASGAGPYRQHEQGTARALYMMSYLCLVSGYDAMLQSEKVSTLGGLL